MRSENSNTRSDSHPGRFKNLWARASETKEKRGFPGLCKAGILFLISPFIDYEWFYLIGRPVKTDYSLSNPQYEGAIKDLASFVVSSNAEADKIEKEGYEFRSCPTPWNFGHGSYKRWLDAGAIAICTFVGKEFAAINWVILSEQVQRRVTYSVKINYSDHEAMTRGYWVNPKYRGQGLTRYTVRSRDKFLVDNGVTITKGPVSFSNKVGYGLTEALGAKEYGRARLIMIFGWQFWKETLYE